jgi:hypothetical protein
LCIQKILTQIDWMWLMVCRLHHQAAQQRHLLKKTPVQQLYPSLDSLNQLGSVPWIVNESVCPACRKFKL